MRFFGTTTDMLGLGGAAEENQMNQKVSKNSEGTKVVLTHHEILSWTMVLHFRPSYSLPSICLNHAAKELLLAQGGSEAYAQVSR
jgi:hypothetical protein